MCSITAHELVGGDVLHGLRHGVWQIVRERPATEGGKREAQERLHSTILSVSPKP